MNSVRHLRISVGLLVAIIAIGTLGYSFIEGGPPFDVTDDETLQASITQLEKLAKGKQL